MGKKKASRKPLSDARSRRKEPYTNQRMAAVLDKVREQAARLAGLTRAMDDSHIDEIVVDGHAMLVRGLNQIENFIDNASRAVREAKTSREIL